MGDPARGMSAKLRNALKIGLINLIVLVLLFAVLEGAASILFIANEIRRTPAVPEHQHADHDTLLGWVNRPNVHIPDMYGAGVSLRTNGQGFRNERDFPREVAPGKVRVVCSGDSFTLGFGVADDQTWCQRLAALDPRLETVNMGQGGYGVDQAYLWYMRDGRQLDHHVQILAFLTDDFHRMRRDRFMGYGKPLLAVDGDTLVVTNLPVPNTSSFARWRALHGETIAQLNIVRVSRRLLRLDGRAPDTARVTREDQRVRDVMSRIFESLRRTNDAKASRLVLVYLPGTWDYKPDPDTDAWRRFVRAEAERRQILYFDLVDAVRTVPSTGIDALYAPNAHFSVAGNAWAAGALHQRLRPLFDSVAAGAPMAKGALPPASDSGAPSR